VADFVANCFPLPLIRVPYEVAAVEYNDFIIDTLGLELESVFASLRELVKIKKVPSVRKGLTSLVFGVLDGELDDLGDIFNDIAEGVIGYFEGWYEFLKLTFQYGLGVLYSLFINFDALGASCSLCSADPTPVCNLRQTGLLPVEPFDCDRCHEHVADGWGLLGAFADALLGNFVSQLSSANTSFYRIARAFGCVVRSTYMYPFQILDAIISAPFYPASGCIAPADLPSEVFDVADPDSLISRWFLAGPGVGDPYDCSNTPTGSQTCCGKPSGCVFPSAGGSDLPIGIAPCFAELFSALTDDEIDDWLDIILSFLLEVIYNVIITVERVSFCFAPPPSAGYGNLTQCFDNFLAQTPVGALGVCAYDTAQDPTPVVPIGGIHQCTNIIYQCLADDPEANAPLLVPLVEGTGTTVLKFFLVDFLKYTIDFVFCPFVNLGQCFAQTCLVVGGPGNPCSTLQKVTDAFDDVIDCSPGWTFIFRPIVALLDFILSIIGPIQTQLETIEAEIAALTNAFNRLGECVSECYFQPLTNLKICDNDAEEFSECLELPGSQEGGNNCEDGDGGETSNCVDLLPDELALDSLPSNQTNLLEIWLHFIYDELEMQEGSFCGDIVSKQTPVKATMKDMDLAEYMGYHACLSMYGSRAIVSARCMNATGEDPADRNFSKTDSVFYDYFANVMSDENCPLEVKKQIASGSHLFSSMAPKSPISAINTTATFSLASTIFSLFNSTNPETNQTAVSTFLTSTMEAIQGSVSYARTTEMMTAYKEAVAANQSKEELETIYIEWANDIVSIMNRGGLLRNESRPGFNDTAESYVVGLRGETRNYHTLESLRFIKQHALRRMNELHVFEVPLLMAPFNESQTNASSFRFDAHAGLSAETLEHYQTVNAALGLDFSPVVQFLAGTVRALRLRDGSHLAGMLSGKTRYLASKGEFVSDTKWRMLKRSTPSALDVLRNPVLRRSVKMVDAALNGGSDHVAFSAAAMDAAAWMSPEDDADAYSTRSVERRFAPFPVPVSPEGEVPHWSTPHDPETMGAPLRERIWTHLNATRQKYRTQRLGLGVSQENESDANQALYDALDWFFALFNIGGAEGLFNSLVANTVTFWESFSLREFTEENVEEFFLDLFSCTLPRNINGTTNYSPFCVTLWPEDAMRLLSAVTNTEGQFPPQLPWPEVLVSRQCESYYSGSGSDDVFAWEPSNNCLLDVAEEELTNCLATGSCFGGGNVRVRSEQGNFNRTLMRYRIEPLSGAACSITLLSVQVPSIGTSVVDVRTKPVNVPPIDGYAPDCVKGWSVSTSFSNVSCAGPPTSLDTRVLQVTLEFSNSEACGVDIVFDEPVQWSPTGAPLAFGSNTNECLACSSQVPGAVAVAGITDKLVDPYRTSRIYCEPANLCDYCDRDYFNCADVGMGDWLDSLLYITGVIPRVIDELLFGGIDSKLVESWIAPIAVSVGLFQIVASLPFCLFCGLSLLILWGIIFIAFLPTWILFIGFGAQLPYALVFFVSSILGQIEGLKKYAIFAFALAWFSPGLDIFVRLLLSWFLLGPSLGKLKLFFRFTSVVLGVIFTIYLLNLIFTFPRLAQVLNINEAILDVVKVVDDSLLFAWLDLRGLIVKLERFTFFFGTETPEVLDFCFKWNIANLALAGLVLLFGIYLISLAIRWVLAVILLVLAFFVWIFATVRTFRVLANQGTLMDHTDMIERLKGKWAKLKDTSSIKKMFKGSQKEQEVVDLPTIESRFAGSKIIPLHAKESSSEEEEEEDQDTESSDPEQESKSEPKQEEQQLQTSSEGKKQGKIRRRKRKDFQTSDSEVSAPAQIDRRTVRPSSESGIF
jgi:hypothetical protein